MAFAELYETVFVIGKRTSFGKFDIGNCRVFDKNGYHWIVEEQFSIKSKLSDDPCNWNQEQVNIWMKWAENEYNITNLNKDLLKINGKQLTSDDFCWNIAGVENKLSNDDFWTHVCLLKTMHRVYIKHKDEECVDISTLINYKNQINSDTDFNYDIEIWRFLLNLLTDNMYTNVIEWVDNEGTFRIIKPNTVSIMWGLTKKNWRMNYKKMAAALRYHYGRGIIKSAKGKFLYKFDSDIKTMIGHSPMELKIMFEHQPII